MASIEFQHGVFLLVDPSGLMHDSYNGWTMRSDMKVALRSREIDLGEFKSGPDFRTKIRDFTARTEDSCSYAPQFDGDSDDSQRSFSLQRLASKIEIALQKNWMCELDENRNWTAELAGVINAEFELCAALGCVASYLVHTEFLEECICVNSSLTIMVNATAADEFLGEVADEMEKIEQKRDVESK